ncbi:MAG TPA: alpha/beta hydrolase [Caulobacteraceae bacterium]|jgi:pimeloyl-ACP methyl ester carboxylesterase
MTEFADRFWTSADGLNLYARDYPGADGPAKLPVICIHGLTRNSRDFEEVAPRIAAQGRRVLAVDVRGRGRSDYDQNPANYQPPVYGGDMIALMAQAGIARAVFVGTSMGGLITMAIAAMNPPAVAAAVLNDVGPELSPVGLGRILTYVGGRKGPVESWDDAADFAQSINGLAFPDAGPEHWRAFARRIFREENGRPVLDYDPKISQAFAAYDPSRPQPDLWPLFQAFTTGRRVLFVHGGISDLVDDPIAERMRAVDPELVYARVPNVGHAPMLTEPEAREALDRFLAEVP